METSSPPTPDGFVKGNYDQLLLTLNGIKRIIMSSNAHHRVMLPFKSFCTTVAAAFFVHFITHCTKPSCCCLKIVGCETNFCFYSF